MKKSLYEIILENIDGDGPKNDFSLPSDEDVDGIRFADGAMDGISVYHLGKAEMDASGTKQMIKAVKSCSQGSFKDADEQFAVLGKTFRAIGIIDELQRYIIAHSRRIDAGKLYQTAVYLIMNSANKESVKFGLEILELLKVDESEKTVVRRLGLSDEFTIFAIWNMLKWDNGNEEVFSLVQKVHGWGKVHAVERLEASTAEIRKWLLLHGIDNTVTPAYSALTVWNKANVAERLKGELTEDEFKSIGCIFSALLDEGPVPGISEVDNPEESVLDYISQANSFNLDVDDYQTIMDLNSWAATDAIDSPAVCAACSDLLSTDHCRETVEEAVKKGNGLRLAEALGIDYAEGFFECLSSDFDNQYRQASYLTCLEDYFEPVVNLFRKRLPLEDMYAEPTGEMCWGPEYELYGKLETIIIELSDHPNIGEDLLAAGLHAPGVRTRNTALLTLAEWTRKTETPISSLSPELYSELEEAYYKEVDDDIKMRIRDLLNGVIPNDTDVEEYEDE